MVLPSKKEVWACSVPAPRSRNKNPIENRFINSLPLCYANDSSPVCACPFLLARAATLFDGRVACQRWKAHQSGGRRLFQSDPKTARNRWMLIAAGEQLEKSFHAHRCPK